MILFYMRYLFCAIRRMIYRTFVVLSIFIIIIIKFYFRQLGPHTLKHIIHKKVQKAHKTYKKDKTYS